MMLNSTTKAKSRSFASAFLSSTVVTLLAMYAPGTSAEVAGASSLGTSGSPKAASQQPINPVKIAEKLGAAPPTVGIVSAPTVGGSQGATAKPGSTSAPAPLLPTRRLVPTATMARPSEPSIKPRGGSRDPFSPVTAATSPPSQASTGAASALLGAGDLNSSTLNMECLNDGIKEQGRFVGKIQNRLVYKLGSQYCFEVEAPETK